MRARRVGGFQAGVVKAAVAALVAQSPVARVDRQAHYRALGGAGEGRGQFAQLQRVGPAARGHEPDLRGRIGLEAQRLNRITDGMAIKREAQFRRARLDPFQVQFQQRNAVFRGEAHRLDQIASGGVETHETPFDQALAPFGQCLTIRDDGRADPQHRLAAPVFARRQPQGADCHIERGIASGIDPANGAAIRPARIAFHRIDQFHRPDLGRAGDRTAREQRTQQVCRAAPRLQPRPHRGDHLVDRGIAFDRKGPVHLDAARLGHAGQVVAHQVDDHQVLGPVLDRGGELLRQPRVFRAVAAARARALHRFDQRRPVARGKEQLWREAEQPVRAIEHDPAITRARSGPDRGIERQRITPERTRERKGQVGLINVPRRNRVLHRAEHPGIAAGRDLRLDRADLGKPRLGMGGQPVRHGIGRDGLEAVERAEPHQRPRRSDPRCGERSQARLQRKARLIGHVSGQFEAFRAQFLDPRQRRGDVFHAPRDNDLARGAIEPGVAGAAGAGVV